MSEIIPQVTQEQINYALDFGKNLNSWNYLYNPISSNMFLKNSNMNPAFKDKESVKDMIYNPKDNEMPLRRVSQHLYNTQTPYKRLIHYFANLLTFDIVIDPINATEADVKTDKFKKEYDKVWNWLDRFDYVREFQKILPGMLLEDAKFTYLRDEGNKITLHEMPSDYALIDAWGEYGWLYSFNLMYFQQIGVDINGFAPEFKKWYRNALDVMKNKTYYPNIRPEQRNGRWFYWQQLNPDKSWVFKFDYPFAGLVPPFLGLFTDAIDIDTYKALQKNKTVLEAYKMIIGTVPRNKDNKSGNTKDDFAVQADTLGKFMQLVRNDLPDGLLFKAVPLDNLQAFSFDDSPTGKDIVGSAVKNFYKFAGADQNLFNSEKPNIASMKASTRIDAAFMEVIYPQFASFITYHINKQTKKFKFKASFIGTTLDQETRHAEALSELAVGITDTLTPAKLGRTEKQLRIGLSLMSSLGYPDNFKPVQSAYQSSNKDNGRPTKDDGTLGDAGALTRERGSNESE